MMLVLGKQLDWSAWKNEQSGQRCDFKRFRYFTPYLKIMSKLAKQIGDRLKEAGGVKDAHELDLSNLGLTEISKDTKKAIEKAKAIEVVILSDNQLTSIEGLPEWELVAIDLSSNKLNDASLAGLSRFPTIMQLDLSSNQINTLEGLAPLFSLSLEELDLLENPVAELPNYRAHLFEKIPTLKVLDRADKDGNEVEAELQDLDDEEDEDDEDDSEQEFLDEDDDDESESQPKKKK